MDMSPFRKVPEHPCRGEADDLGNGGLREPTDTISRCVEVGERTRKTLFLRWNHMPSQTDAITPDPQKLKETRRTLRVLLSAISLVIVGMGAMAIWSEHYYGVSTKHGNVSIVLDGAPAIRMGLTLVLLGLVPMGVWWNTTKAVLAWSIAFAIAFGTSLLYMLIQSSH
jgi:hypothetical protein